MGNPNLFKFFSKSMTPTACDRQLILTITNEHFHLRTKSIKDLEYLRF